MPSISQGDRVGRSVDETVNVGIDAEVDMGAYVDVGVVVVRGITVGVVVIVCRNVKLGETAVGDVAKVESMGLFMPQPMTK